MKLNKILKIITCVVPAMIMFSCSFQKNKLNEAIPDKNHQSTHSQANINLSDPSEVLKQDNIIYFDLNKFNVNSKFSKILNNTIIFLHNHPDVNIIIEGHTDKRGLNKYNIELGKRRANAVKIYLESKGISSKQISIISYGADKPVDNGDTEDAYSKNRRAVIVY
ncbi:MAG: OmpA family protein [Buchnera aphidicola (Nurudea yanoniella)]